MRCRLWGVVSILLLMSAGGAWAQLSVVEMMQRAVVTDKVAYIAYPPELVSEPVVTSLTVSASGRYALAQRMVLPTPTGELTLATIQAGQPQPLQNQPAQNQALPTPPQLSLILWDSRTHLRQTLWKASAADVRIQQVIWLPKTDIAFAEIWETVPHRPDTPTNAPAFHMGLLRISAVTGRAVSVDLGDLAGSDMLQITPSPTLSLSLLRCTRVPGAGQGSVVTLAMLDEVGHIGPHVELPKDARVLQTDWNDKGQPLVQIQQRSKDPKGEAPAWWAMNTRTGELTRLPGDPKSPQIAVPGKGLQFSSPSASPLRVNLIRLPVPITPNAGRMGLLWLESTSRSEAKPDTQNENKNENKTEIKTEIKPENKNTKKVDRSHLLLSSDSTGGQLIANGSMVLYHSQGAVWAVPLVKIDLDTFEQVRRQADRTRTMQRAKQAGLALIMFAMDYEETLPPGDNIVEHLTPYAQDVSLFDGFNYTYPGGKLAAIANPAQTIIGTMAGEDGQANIYADGHVKWE